MWVLERVFCSMCHILGGKEGKKKVTSPLMGSWWCHITTHRFFGLQVNQPPCALIGCSARRGGGFFFSFFPSRSWINPCAWVSSSFLFASFVQLVSKQRLCPAMVCPGTISSDAVAGKKKKTTTTAKPAKLALFTEELSPGGLSGGSCLFSWPWWRVSWTLRCTLPSAVKHNATRLHQSGVWGYRWPAVRLCSSPLRQLEPSINCPPPTPPQFTPVVSVCEGLTSNTAVQGCLIGSSRGTFYVFFLILGHPIWHFYAAKPFSIITPIFWRGWQFGLWSSALWGHFWGASADSPLEDGSSSSSQHVQSRALSPSADGKNRRPLLCSWRGVFIRELSGTLLKKVAIMYSVWFSGFGTKGYPQPPPPANSHTHAHPRKESKQCQSIFLWNLFLFIKTRIAIIKGPNWGHFQFV